MRFIISLFIATISSLVAGMWALAAGMVVSDDRYYLTGTGDVVKEDDPNASTLLFGKGVQIPEATARQYGLDHLKSPTQLTRVEANRAQWQAAKDRGAFEEMRSLDARLPADTAADEADPEMSRVLVGGHAEAHLTGTPVRASNPPTGPAGINGLAVPSGDLTDPHGKRTPSSGADAAGVSPATTEEDEEAKARSAAAANKARTAAPENKGK